MIIHAEARRINMHGETLLGVEWQRSTKLVSFFYFLDYFHDGMDMVGTAASVSICYVRDLRRWGLEATGVKEENRMLDDH